MKQPQVGRRDGVAAVAIRGEAAVSLGCGSRACGLWGIRATAPALEVQGGVEQGTELLDTGCNRAADGWLQGFSTVTTR